MLPPSQRQAPAEREFLTALTLVRSGEWQPALAATQRLLQRWPTFELADALAADVAALARGERPRLDWFGPVPALRSAGDVIDAGLAGLAEEAARRWSHRNFQLDGYVPKALLRLAPSTRHVLVVETRRSRLYAFRHRADGLELEGDYYVSIGRGGAGKRVDGDLRTPIGVYFTLSRMDDPTLAERYGEHAFPLNYPNRWDRRLARTGRGIWLHGVPHDTYSRPPRDSEGCVALTNEDIARLAARLDPRFTPVVITETVEWVPRAHASEGEAVRTLFARVRAWQGARSARASASADEATSSFVAFYERAVGSRAAQGSGEATGAALPFRAMDPRASSADWAIVPGTMSAFAYPGERDLVLVTFEERRTALERLTGKAARGWRRQYWRRDAKGVWHIAAERAGG